MRMLWTCLLVGSSAIAGCSKQPEASAVVPIGEVPEDVKKIAQEKLPDIQFDTAWKIKVDGEDAYELRGKNQRGRVREVEVSASGKVLEVE